MICVDDSSPNFCNHFCRKIVVFWESRKQGVIVSCHFFCADFQKNFFFCCNVFIKVGTRPAKFFRNSGKCNNELYHSGFARSFSANRPAVGFELLVRRFLVLKFQPILKGLRQTAFRENVYHSLLQEKHLCLVLIMLPHKIQYLSDLVLFQLLLQVL